MTRAFALQISSLLLAKNTVVSVRLFLDLLGVILQRPVSVLSKELVSFVLLCVQCDISVDCLVPLAECPRVFVFAMLVSMVVIILHMFHVEMAPSLSKRVMQVRDIRRMLRLQFLFGPLVFHF